MIPVLDPTKNWECPACGHQHVTREARPHVPMHSCPAVGLLAPMIEVHGTELDRSAVRFVVKEREDYVGAETVTYAHHRPVTALVTERADGSNDCRAYAGVATATTSL